MNCKLLGAKIKQVRIKRKLTQDKLSEMCNLSATFLGIVEGGWKKPSLESLVRIANVLDVSLDYLLSDSLKLSSETRIEELVSAVKNLDSKDLDMVVDMVNTLISHIKKDN